MNDALRVEDYEVRLRVLFPSRKAGVSAGRENARLPVVAIWRAGTVDARFFVGRRSKGDDRWIDVKTPSERVDLKRENWPPGWYFDPFLGHTNHKNRRFGS